MRWIWTAGIGWAACLVPKESSQTEGAESQLGRTWSPSLGRSLFTIDHQRDKVSVREPCKCLRPLNSPVSESF